MCVLILVSVSVDVQIKHATSGSRRSLRRGKAYMRECERAARGGVEQEQREGEQDERGEREQRGAAGPVRDGWT